MPPPSFPAARKESEEPAALRGLDPEQRSAIARLMEVGISFSGAVHAVRRFMEAVRATLKRLSDWMPYMVERATNLAGYLFRVIENGGLRGYPPAGFVAITEQRKAARQRIAVHQPPREEEPSAPRAPVPAPSPLQPAAAAQKAEELTPHQKERLVEKAAKEAESMSLQVQFDLLWPKLSETEKNRARRQARKLVPPVLARQVQNVETSEVYQAVLRGQVVELFRHRLEPDTEASPDSPTPTAANAASTTLPLKTRTGGRLSKGKNAFLAMREILDGVFPNLPDTEGCMP